MSKIIRDHTQSSTFVDSLEEAATLRNELLRSKPHAMTQRDARRESARAEGYEIGVEQGIEIGQEQGREQAFKEAKSELEQENAEQIQQFAEGMKITLEQFQTQQQEWYVQAESRLADLAIEIAKRAIARELESSRESVAEIAHQVLEEVTESSKVKLHVNPLDGSYMESRLSGIQAAFSGLENISIVEDKSIDFGCRLETDSGMIDARVEDYLARIIAESRESR